MALREKEMMNRARRTLGDGTAIAWLPLMTFVDYGELDECVMAGDIVGGEAHRWVW
jgi:hypothetical protein